VQFQLRAFTSKFHRAVETQRKEGGEELASARAFVAAFPGLFKKENLGESSIQQTINLSIHFPRQKFSPTFPSPRDERYWCPRIFERSP